METIAKDVNALQEVDRNKRRCALERILKFAQQLSATTNGVDATKAEQLTLMKACLKGFEDKAERCRELAIQIVTELLPKQNVDALDWVLPSVVARIGLEPVSEESEELRLLLLNLAMSCVDAFPHDIGPKNYLDFYRVLLENCLKDPFPELKRAACLACRRLCDIEPKRIKHLAVPLAKVVKLSCLHHKHSVVRADAVKTFSSLLAHGATELLGDMKDEQDHRTTVTYIGILACDNSELVRMAVVEFLSTMLLDIQDRGDQHRRLIPILLQLLTDENEGVRFAANSVLLRLGKLYMLDNEDNSIHVEKRRLTLKDIEWYADECYPDMSLTTKSTLPLPADLNNRPHLGARYVVAEVVRNILDKVLSDCLAMDWTIPFSKHNRRVVALRCLLMLIYFSETNIVQYAQQILAALYKAIKDDNEIVRSEAMVCMELLGKFLTPDQYLPFLISNQKSEEDGVITFQREHEVCPSSTAAKNPELEGDVRVERTKSKTVTVVSASEEATVRLHLPTLFSTAPNTTKSSILIALKYILLGSKQSLTAQQALQVVRALTHPDLIDLDANDLLAALVDVIASFSEVLASRGFIATPEAPLPDAVRLDVKQRTLDSMLLYVLLQIKSSPSAAVVASADAAATKLSLLTTGDPNALFSIHFGRFLIRYAKTMPVSAFTDLVSRASNIQFYTAELVSMFLAILSEVNLSLRITSELQYFAVLENLLRSKVITFTDSQLETLIRCIILNHAQFRPGGPAHLLRKVAIGALAAILDEFHRCHLTDALAEDGGALTEKCAAAWLNAIDSDDGDVRLVCISALGNVVQLPLMSDGCAADIWQHILLRFDDANDQLRLEVATALYSALVNHNVMSGALKSEIRQKMAATVKKLLIHMDDHEETKGIKGMVSKCLMQLSFAEKDIVVALVQQAKSKHHTPRYCDDILHFIAEGRTN